MRVFYFILGILIFVGCSSNQNINLNEKPPKQVPMRKKAVIHKKKGSLYSRSGGSLFADKKDLQIGDIIQVNIQEVLKRDSKNSKTLSKTNTTGLGGGMFTPMSGKANAACYPNCTNTMKNVNSIVGLNFNAQSNNKFSGSSATKNDEQFSTMISVVIVEVYKNGNYFIKGSKELLINNQKQIIAISGVIRPYDISPDNVVQSNQIANLKILYKKLGDEQDNLEKPWGSKLLEKIWPF
jgi:flagellar L-ring protein precursor FlgH